MTEEKIQKLRQLLEDHPTCKLLWYGDKKNGWYIVTVSGGVISPGAALAILEEGENHA